MAQAAAGSSSSGDSSLQELRNLLEDVQLVQFLPRLRDDLQVTQISHFDYVKTDDLERIGLGKPAARRLLNVIKKKRSAAWRKAVVAKLLPGSSSSSHQTSTSGNVKEDLTSLEDVPGGHTSLIQEKDIVIGKRLGDGSYGVVREGEWTTSDGLVRKVAIKVLKVDVVAVAGALEDFMREVTSMTQLTHPNLIRLYGIVLGRPLMMVNELAPLGSLLDILRSVSPPSVITSSTYTLQVCSAMRYLESRRCIHRDLAARNVFLASEDTAKLGDFGLSRSLSQSDDCYIMTEAKKVPFPWCAPESLKTKTFSHASDMWMFGVTMWEVYSRGEEPWAGLNSGEILRNIEAGERMRKPLACPSDIYSLMESSWQMDASVRPTFTAAYEFLVGKVPEVVIARQICNTEGKLSVQIGDRIAVIDGDANKFWWIGENLSSGKLGEFPRCIVESDRPLSGEDISSPLHNSLIHTGHGGTDNTWGSPSHIDEMFLNNPLSPHDKEANEIVSSKVKAEASSGTTLPRKRMSIKEVKRQSLRMKANRINSSNGKAFPYSKFNVNQWPDDVSTKTEEYMLSMAESSMSRNKSYSASDLRCNLAQSNQPLPTLYDTNRSDAGSVSSLTDLPTAEVSTSVSRQQNKQRSSLRVPVRPSPAPPIHKKIKKKIPPSNIYGNVLPEQQTRAPIYRNLPLPPSEESSNLVYGNLPGEASALYDEPPQQQSVYGDYSEATEYYDEDESDEFDDLSPDSQTYSNEIEQVSTIEQIPSTVSNSFNQNEMVDEASNILSNMWIDKVATNPPVETSQQSPIKASPIVPTCKQNSPQRMNNVSSLSKVSSFESDTNSFSIPEADNSHIATSMANVSPKFINELKKSLGQDQASANTFQSSSREHSKAISQLTQASANTFQSSTREHSKATPQLARSVSNQYPTRTPPSTSSDSGLQQTPLFSFNRLPEHPSVGGDGFNSAPETHRQTSAVSSRSTTPISVLRANEVLPKLNLIGVNRTFDSTIMPTSDNSRQQTNLVVANDSPVTAASESARRSDLSLNSVFSDLDVGSSSRTLGLNSKPEIDVKKYFPKNTAHVRPIMQMRNTAPPLQAAASATYYPANSSSYTINSANSFSSHNANSGSAISPYIGASAFTSRQNSNTAINPMSYNIANRPSNQSSSTSYNITNVGGGDIRMTTSLVTSFPRDHMSAPPLTAQELEQFAAPPSSLTPRSETGASTTQSNLVCNVLPNSSSVLPIQSSVLPMASAGLDQQQQLIANIQQQHMQQFGNPLSEQQLKVRLMHVQHQNILIREQQQLQLQQQNLQQIQQLKVQQMLDQRQHREAVESQHRQQPTVVLSPQFTVNYNQMMCGGNAPSGASTQPPTPQDSELSRLVSLVPGATLPEARQAMGLAKGNFQGAVQYLKVEKLYRLGLTNKADCEQILEQNSWELQRAASVLLDKFGS